jgi:hypothetical protein
MVLMVELCKALKELIETAKSAGMYSFVVLAIFCVIALILSLAAE